MTRKHFKLIVDELNAAMELNQNNPEALKATERIVEGLSNVLRQTNPLFNAYKFKTACGLKN